MVAAISLLLFVLLCVPSQQSWIPGIFNGGKSSEAAANATISDASTSRPKPSTDIVDIYRAFLDTSTDQSDRLEDDNKLLDDSSLSFLGEKDSEITSAATPNGKRGLDMSTIMTDFSSPSEDATEIVTKSSESETTTGSTLTSKILTTIIPTSVSSYPTVGTTVSTTAQESTTAIETSAASSSSSKPNKRECEGPECAEANENSSEAVPSESPSISSDSGSSSFMPTTDSTSEQTNFDASRSAGETQNITVISQPSNKTNNSARDVDEPSKPSSIHKPSIPSVPSKNPMSSAGSIVALTDKVSFLLLCVTFFLSSKVTSAFN